MSGADRASVPVDKLSGRALDAEVARDVFGCAVREDEYGEYFCGCGHFEHGRMDRDHTGETLLYSIEMAPAWKVVGRMNHLDHYVSVSRTTDGRAFCKVKPSNHWVGEGIKAGPCATAPLAICRAALKVARGE